MRKMTLTEWIAERQDLFGANPYDAKFVCPKCGNVASGHDFENENIEDPLNRMYSNCLGRFSNEIACDWAAYGLFGTLGKGIIVMNGADKTEVFEYYVEEQG